MRIPSNEFCDSIMEEYCVPAPIRRHCEVVTEVGITLANHLKNAGVDVNISLVEAGCRVHDAFKGASLKELTPLPEMNYTPSQQEIKVWEKLRKRYQDIHETLIAADILRNEYPDFAEVVSQIGSTGNSCYLHGGIELKIMHYADWRVQFDKITSFDDRLAYLCETYKDSWSKAGISWDSRYEQEKQLEKEIFDKLDFTPDDLARVVEEGK